MEVMLDSKLAFIHNTKLNNMYWNIKSSTSITAVIRDTGIRMRIYTTNKITKSNRIKQIPTFTLHTNTIIHQVQASPQL